MRSKSSVSVVLAAGAAVFGSAASPAAAASPQAAQVRGTCSAGGVLCGSVGARSNVRWASGRWGPAGTRCGTSRASRSSTYAA